MKINQTLFILTSLLLTSVSVLAHEPFFDAIRAGDVNAVTQMLSQEAAFARCEDGNGNSALDSAIEFEKEEVVGVLVKKGAEVDRVRPDGRTPLMVAARLGNKGIVDRLIKGPDFEGEFLNFGFRGAVITEAVVEEAKSNGHPLLAHYLQDLRVARLMLRLAVQHRDIDEIRSLNRRYPGIAYGHKDGESLLSESIDHGRLKIALALIEAGADVTQEVLIHSRSGSISFTLRLMSVQEERKGIALMKMVKTESVKEVEDFLVQSRNVLNFRDHEGNSPIHLAVEKRSEEMVRSLLKNGANVRDFPEIYDPLITAVRMGNREIVKALLGVLDMGEDLIPDRSKSAIVTNEIISRARVDGNESLARYLEEVQTSRDAIRAAVLSGDEQKVQDLIEQQVDVTYCDSYGSSPLQEAARCGHLNIARALIAAGSKVTKEVIQAAERNVKEHGDVGDHGKLAAYLKKIEAGRAALISGILGIGSSSFSKHHIDNVDGNVNYFLSEPVRTTPIRVAVDSGNLEILNQLVAAGAIPTQSLVALARRNGDEAMVDRLIDLIYGESGLSTIVRDHAIPSEGVLPLDVAHLISGYVTDIPLPKAPEKRQPLEEVPALLNADDLSDEEKKLP